MKKNKIWFIGYNSRFWMPISIEGWLVAISFFIGIMMIVKINNVSNSELLSISEIIPIVLELILLSGMLFFICKGHVDKRY